MGVKGNIEAREAAEEAMGFVREVEQEFRCTGGAAHDRRFWEEVAGLVADYLPPPSEQDVCRQAGKMTQAEARRFGHETMPYGEYQGVAVDQVPLERLQWYADQTFTDDLRHYLQSDRITHSEGSDDEH